jgi:hypothetical protein
VAKVKVIVEEGKISTSLSKWTSVRRLRLMVGEEVAADGEVTVEVKEGKICTLWRSHPSSRSLSMSRSYPCRSRRREKVGGRLRRGEAAEAELYSHRTLLKIFTRPI